MATVSRLGGRVLGLLALQIIGGAVAAEESGGLFPRGGPLVLFGAHLAARQLGANPVSQPLYLEAAGEAPQWRLPWLVGGSAQWESEPGKGRFSAAARLGYLPGDTPRRGEWGAELAFMDFVPNHRIGLVYSEAEGTWRSATEGGIGAWGGHYGLGILPGQWLEAGVRQERRRAATPDLTDYYLRWRLDL